jgi:predicted transcriptional regulator
MNDEVDNPVLRCLADTQEPLTAFQIRTKTSFDHRTIYLSLRGLLEAKLIERATKGSSGTTYKLTRDGKTMISKVEEEQC